MSVDYIRMTECRENLIYEINQIMETYAQEMGYSNDALKAESDVIEKLSESIVDIGIKVNMEDRLELDSLSEQTFQLSNGKQPYFINLEKNYIKIALTLMLSFVMSYPKRKEDIVSCIFKIAKDVFLLYYNLRTEIKNEEYCIYIYCVAISKINQYINEQQIITNYIKPECEMNPNIPKWGLCVHYGMNGKKCKLTEEKVHNILQKLCDAGVLKPYGEKIYQFYK